MTVRPRVPSSRNPSSGQFCQFTHFRSNLCFLSFSSVLSFLMWHLSPKTFLHIYFVHYQYPEIEVKTKSWTLPQLACLWERVKHDCFLNFYSCNALSPTGQSSLFVYKYLIDYSHQFWPHGLNKVLIVFLVSIHFFLSCHVHSSSYHSSSISIS